MDIVLGIDPGSRVTGYGLVYKNGHKIGCIAHGHIPCQQETMPERLYHIHESLSAVIQKHQPTCVSIEKIFTHINHSSALKLGQARGVALVAAAHYALDVYEYSAKQIKQSVVGYGAADKAQVQHMVTQLLQLKQAPQADAADALAMAICHCNSQHLTHILQKNKDKI